MYRHMSSVLKSCWRITHFQTGTCSCYPALQIRSLRSGMYSILHPDVPNIHRGSTRKQLRYWRGPSQFAFESLERTTPTPSALRTAWKWFGKRCVHSWVVLYASPMHNPSREGPAKPKIENSSFRVAGLTTSLTKLPAMAVVTTRHPRRPLNSFHGQIASCARGWHISMKRPRGFGEEQMMKKSRCRC